MRDRLPGVSGSLGACKGRNICSFNGVGVAVGGTKWLKEERGLTCLKGTQAGLGLSLASNQPPQRREAESCWHRLLLSREPLVDSKASMCVCVCCVCSVGGGC